MNHPGADSVVIRCHLNLKARKGDLGSIALAVNLREQRSDTKSGEGKDRWLCVEVTYIYCPSGLQKNFWYVTFWLSVQ